MSPQVPKLLQSHARNIHNVITLRDRRARVFSIGQRRTQRHHEPNQVLVEREEAQEFCGRLSICRRFAMCFFGGFLICGHGFGVQMFDFVDVDGDSATVATAGPLGVLIAC